jgi:hypothetical protein
MCNCTLWHRLNDTQKNHYTTEVARLSLLSLVCLIRYFLRARSLSPQLFTWRAVICTNSLLRGAQTELIDWVCGGIASLWPGLLAPHGHRMQVSLRFPYLASACQSRSIELGIFLMPAGLAPIYYPTETNYITY